MNLTDDEVDNNTISNTDTYTGLNVNFTLDI